MGSTSDCTIDAGYGVTDDTFTYNSNAIFAIDGPTPWAPRRVEGLLVDGCTLGVSAAASVVVHDASGSFGDLTWASGASDLRWEDCAEADAPEDYATGEAITETCSSPSLPYLSPEEMALVFELDEPIIVNPDISPEGSLP